MGGLWMLDMLRDPPKDEVAEPVVINTIRSGEIVQTVDGLSPGDHYAASNTWQQILEGDGWTLHHRDQTGTLHWTRPGKEKRDGSSATTGHEGSKSLHVFTSSIAGLDADTSYTKFGYFAATRHGGDHQAAAAALANIERDEQMRKWGASMSTQNAAESLSLQTQELAGAQNGSSPVVVDEERTTDVGNAVRLVEQRGHDFRYEPGLGWLFWCGTHWQRDLAGVIREAAKSVASGLWLSAANAVDSDRRKTLAKWAATSETASRLAAMVELAKTDPRIVITADQLNTDPMLLNASNGTVDLRTGELRPHDRADYITKIAGAAFDATAPRPVWNKFLGQITANDSALAEYLQTAFGYSATGEVSEHILFVAHGTGGNGKSTCLEVVASALGDYALAAESDLLIAKRNDAHPTGIADLCGARFVIALETDNGRRLDEGVAKRLTGGDTVKARFMGRDFFQWKPTHTLWLVTNHRPRIFGTDDGIWRRIREVPFTVQIRDEAIDKNMPAKLGEELGGVLAWIVAGARRWHEGGLEACFAVQRATAEYRTAEDTIGEFLSDWRAENPTGTIPAATLAADYKAWCDERLVKPAGQRIFAGELRSRGFVETRATVAGKTQRAWILPEDSAPISALPHELL